MSEFKQILNKMIALRQETDALAAICVAHHKRQPGQTVMTDRGAGTVMSVSAALVLEGSHYTLQITEVIDMGDTHGVKKREPVQRRTALAEEWLDTTTIGLPVSTNISGERRKRLTPREELIEQHAKPNNQTPPLRSPGPPQQAAKPVQPLGTEFPDGSASKPRWPIPAPPTPPKRKDNKNT